MKCLRCLDDTASEVAIAPDGSGAWAIYYCKRCNYSWRDTEEECVTVLEKRNPRFQLDKTDFDKIPALI
jgi:late competence protein required for DNA uptake (superfamily II DNA/RNA helicase)